MAIFSVICPECNVGSPVTHPAINTLDKLKAISTNCGWCGKPLAIPDNPRVMVEATIKPPNRNLPRSPLSDHDELAALRDRLNKK